MTSNLSQIPLIDASQLDELFQMVGKEFAPIIAAFKFEIFERLEKINSGNLNLEQLEAEFHSLASSGGNLGMLRFSKFSRELMTMAEAEDMEAIEEAKLLKSLYEESLTGLTAALAKFQ